ncbi:MAG: NAD-dependent epimerase/dehydratase family protein [Thermodesulfobacteriota bacterium]
MRVLVTGSNGYIGSVLVPLLVKEGHEVQGFDSDLYAACTYGQDFPDFRFKRKDIRDAELSDIDGYDAVIHLAALSNDPLSDLNPRLTFDINHEASVKLGRLAKEAGVKRFLFSSSCSTYGASGDNILNEEASFNPVTPYGTTKVLVERDVAALADDTFSPTFLRNATAYGVSPRMRFDLVINNLVAWAFASGLVYLKSDGTPWRPLVHVEDIARAFITILQAPRETVQNQAFNIGSNSENYRILDLAKIVEKTVPGCRIEFAKDASPDKRCYRVDFGKFHSTFPDYKHKWDAVSGAEEIYQSYKKHGIRQEDFEGPRYKRIDHIKQLLSTGRLDETLRWTLQKA